MVQGRGVDSSLNETGRNQAKLFHENYHQIPFDKVYSSSLKRTTESITGFIDQGLAHESLSDLDEISWGSHEGLPYDKQTHGDYLDVVANWASGNLDVCVGGGDTPNQVVARLEKAFKYILSKNDEQTILIATHGRTMRILLCYLLNYDLKHMDIFKHSNLCLYALEYTGSIFRLSSYNNTTHLG